VALDVAQVHDDVACRLDRSHAQRSLRDLKQHTCQYSVQKHHSYWARSPSLYYCGDSIYKKALTVRSMVAKRAP
jgi:hypothetical protein